MISKQFQRAGLNWLLAVATSFFCAAPAMAAVQEITAQFRPDPTNPMSNKFTNTTPESGICPWHIPARCKALGIFSIRTMDITFSSNGPMLLTPGSGDSRKGVMFKVPSEWRNLDVVSESGERTAVEVRIAGIGNRVDVARPATIHSWAPRTWLFAPAPCLSSGYMTGVSQYALWFWLVPANAGACNLLHTTEIPKLDYVTFEYAYELRTPNPLTMQAGTYRGSTTYTVGPNKDFDFGDIMIPSDDALIFNFTLDVTHILKVEIPPGGNQVELVPQGGWQSWVQQGRRPQRLFRDQTFNIWTTTPFKMQLQCGDVFGNTCAITNALGHQVPVDIAVSLPGGISDRTRQHVRQRLLRLDGVGTELFQPTHYVDRRPGTLHFEIQKPYVEQMLTPKHAGQRYSGSVTVIWDSET